MSADDLPRERDELAPAAPWRARALGDLDQLADHMAPAELLLEDIEEVVADVAITDDEAAEVLAEQRLGRLLAARRVDPVARGQGRRGDPQPLLGTRKAPGRVSKRSINCPAD